MEIQLVFRFLLTLTATSIFAVAFNHFFRNKERWLYITMIFLVITNISFAKLLRVDLNLYGIIILSSAFFNITFTIGRNLILSIISPSTHRYFPSEAVRRYVLSTAVYIYQTILIKHRRQYSWLSTMLLELIIHFDIENAYEDIVIKGVRYCNTERLTKLTYRWKYPIKDYLVPIRIRFEVLNDADILWVRIFKSNMTKIGLSDLATDFPTSEYDDFYTPVFIQNGNMLDARDR